MISHRILFILTFVGIASPLAAQNALPTTALQREEAATLKPLPANGDVKLKTIARDFSYNPVAAMGKYSKHELKVTGQISRIVKEEDNLVVILQDAEPGLPAVEADFPFGSTAKNSEILVSDDLTSASILKRTSKGSIVSQKPFLTVGQHVDIMGIFKELKPGVIVLGNCRLAHKKK